MTVSTGKLWRKHFFTEIMIFVTLLSGLTKRREHEPLGPHRKSMLRHSDTHHGTNFQRKGEDFLKMTRFFGPILIDGIL